MGSEDFVKVRRFVEQALETHYWGGEEHRAATRGCTCTHCLGHATPAVLGHLEREHAELASALVQLQRDLVVMQQARDEAQAESERLIAHAARVRSERDEARGEVLGLQRMLEEALKPGFHASACPWCHRPLTARGVTLHLPHCRKRPGEVGHS